jgi:hypothetical protein
MGQKQYNANYVYTLIRVSINEEEAKMKNTSIFILMTILFFSIPTPAATHTWVDDAIGFWDVDSNWIGGEPAGDFSTAYINNGTATVRYSDEAVVKGFYVGDAGSSDGTVRIVSGGDLTVGDSSQTTFFGDAGKGTLDISGGTYNALVGIIMGDNSSGEGVINLNSGLFDTSWSISVGNDGTGTITQTDGTFNSGMITLGDDNGSTGTYQISGGTLSASSLRLGIHYIRTSDSTFDIQSSDPNSPIHDPSNDPNITFTGDFSILSANSVFTADPGSKIKMAGKYADFINELDAANQLNVLGLKNLTMEFTGNPTATYCTYEAASKELDPNAISYCGGNFTLDTLAVGGSTPSRVALVDYFDNGNGGIGNECLYVRKLIVTAGSTLNLSGLNLYYLEAQIDGTVSGGTPTIYPSKTDIDNNGQVDMEDVKIIANNWLSTGCSCPDYCNGADINLDGRVDLQDLALVAMDWLEGTGGDGGKFWEETFDSDPGWSTQGEWAFGTPTGDGGESNGNPDPNSGYTGSNVYGVNLSGDYSTTVTGAYRYVTTTAINCTGRTNVELRFWRWLNTDLPAYAPAKIEVSDNNSDWSDVWVSSGEITDSMWNQQLYDVSAYADGESTFYIRWGYEIKDFAYEYSGWNIDDIELWEVP